MTSFTYPEHAWPFEVMFLVFKRDFPHEAHTCAQHLSTAGSCCLSWKYTAIVPVFTLDTLHRWPNGAVAVQFTLARNPEGSGVETNNSAPNKLIFTTWVSISTDSQSFTYGAKSSSNQAEQRAQLGISFLYTVEAQCEETQDFRRRVSYLGTEEDAAECVRV